jgi:hypothetical protein
MMGAGRYAPTGVPTVLATAPPFVWPCVPVLLGEADYALPVPFQPTLENAATVLGVASAVDHCGGEWLETVLGERPSLNALVILAVFAGCPTRRRDLEGLIDLQARAKGGVQFRVLPMAMDVGAPANCLVAMPSDGAAPVFLVGPTPNFGIDGADRTQVNLAFAAEAALFDQWRRWFDWTWLQAAPLTDVTADIPALVPATGTPEAAAQWRAYCAICGESEQPAAPAIDPETGEVQPAKKADGSEDPPPTTVAGLSKLDKLADRVARLFSAGRQVTIAYSSAIRPLDAPVSPRVFGQEAEHRDGTVVQRQSFRISVFSEEELKQINDYRRGSQTIIEKLGLPLEKGLYWLPNKVIPIFEKEIKVKNEEAQKALAKLVGGNAENFVTNKIAKIRQDLAVVYRRLGGNGDVPASALTELVDDLTLRIEHAFGEQFVAPVTFSEVHFSLPKESSSQAPWAQAKKLILALARFPREVLARPKALSGLQTPRPEILTAMNVEDDAILKVANGRQREDRARAETQILDRITGAKITDRDSCEAGFMLIDGRSSIDIDRFIAEKESAR